VLGQPDGAAKPVAPAAAVANHSGNTPQLLLLLPLHRRRLLLLPLHRKLKPCRRCFVAVQAAADAADAARTSPRLRFIPLRMCRLLLLSC
jgi:hypothetical protein